MQAHGMYVSLCFFEMNILARTAVKAGLTAPASSESMPAALEVAELPRAGPSAFPWAPGHMRHSFALSLAMSAKDHWQKVHSAMMGVRT